MFLRCAILRSAGLARGHLGELDERLRLCSQLCNKLLQCLYLCKQLSNYQCARAQEHLQSLPSPISRSCPLRSHQGPCAFPDGAVSFRMTNCCAARARRFSAAIGTATAGAADGCPERSAESFAAACATASVEPSSPAALEGSAEASLGSSLPDSAEGPSAAAAADVTAELATSACGAAEVQ